MTITRLDKGHDFTTGRNMVSARVETPRGGLHVWFECEHQWVPDGLIRDAVLREAQRRVDEAQALEVGTRPTRGAAG